MPASRPGFVVNIQSRMLDGIVTRVVIPLIRTDLAPKAAVRTLNPIFSIEGADHMLMTQNIASVPLSQLQAPIGSLVEQRDDIVRAIDALLSGL